MKKFLPKIKIKNEEIPRHYFLQYQSWIKIVQARVIRCGQLLNPKGVCGYMSHEKVLFLKVEIENVICNVSSQWQIYLTSAVWISIYSVIDFI